MNIAGAVAIAAFGHDSHKPKRKAIVLCSSLLIISVVIGVFASIQIRQNPVLRSWPYPHDILFALTLCLQMVMLVCLASSRGILDAEVVMIRLLHLLPFTDLKRWLLIHMPQLLLLVLVLMASVPTLQACLTMLGLNLLWSLPIVSGASLSALGLCYGLPSKGIARLCLGTLCVALEAWTLRLILNVTSPPPAKVPYYCLFLLLVLAPILGLRFASNAQPYAKLHYVTIHLPWRLWYLAKIMRSYTGRTSFLFAVLCMALIAAGAAYIHEYSAAFLCTTGGLVLASFCSDIRSLASMKHPPEIVALRGTWYFTKKQMSSTAIGVFAAMPVIVYLVIVGTTLSEFIAGILTLLTGSIAGLFAATMIGAKARDISSQCAAVFIGCVLFYLCSRLALLFGDGTTSAIAVLCVLIAALTLVTFAIEYKRNTYIWKEK